MAHSKIEWTEMTWNPVTGCDKVSAGCKHCYAELMANRLKAMGLEKYKNGFQLTLHEEELEKPYTWKKPQIVFVNSMSDLFHEGIPVEFTQRVFQVMVDNPQHIFQVLTKRADLLYYYDNKGLLEWKRNIWMGVSIENQTVVDRISLLKRTKAEIKFLSCEPLLGPLSNLDLDGIQWVIVGGESGRKPRPMKEKWVQEIKRQCLRAHVPFFFKQWGGVSKKKAGRMLDGRTWDNLPVFSLSN